MSVPPVAVRASMLAALALALGYAWYVTGRGRWRATLERRFLYGVPWGTLVTVAGVLAFYLFAQGGLAHWDDPVTVAFRSWSYFYPTGLLAAGFAHGGPGHLLSNLAGTVVLAPIAEYVWSHYPPGRLADSRTRDLTRFAGGDGRVGRLLARPWVRAVVVFPAAMVAVSVLTSVFALGWSLGFSGTVFAVGGFALVRYPVGTVVGMLAVTGVNVLTSSLLEPVLRATADPGPPGPPSWAVVNVQAHLLGFLIGVLLGTALCWRRRVRPDPGRVFLGVLLFVLARQLWAFAVPGDDGIFLQFRGLGLVFVVLLTVLVTAAVTASDRPLSGLERVPDVGWRHTAVLALAVLAVAVALPSVVSNLPVVAEGATPEEGVTVGDYQVTYDHNVTDGRQSGVRALPVDDWGQSSGVLVISERRHVWSTPVPADVLSHEGTTTVVVGGVGWYETVDVERTGWDVVGDGTAFVVDLSVDGETTRSFTSGRVQADAVVDGHTVAVVPTAAEFRLNVTRRGEAVGETPLPETNETATVGDLTFFTRDGGDLLYAEHRGTRVLVAQRE